ncbi:hypothetical protein STEG23_037522 [Scotinomys teguina]
MELPSCSLEAVSTLAIEACRRKNDSPTPKTNKFSRSLSYSKHNNDRFSKHCGGATKPHYVLKVIVFLKEQDCSLKNREPDVPALLVPGSTEDEVQPNRGGLAPTSRIQEPRSWRIVMPQIMPYCTGYF